MRESDIETWAPVVGYEGLYEVSDRGRVRSIDRTITDKNGRKKSLRGCLLSPLRQASGHLGVPLCKYGVKRRHRVHVLALTAFTGPRPAGLEVRHLDGVPTNNKKGNLVYGTVSENKHDAYAHGGLKTGERSHLAKLSNEDAAKLKALRGQVSSHAAATMFGLDAGYVRAIWRGRKRRYA